MNYTTNYRLCKPVKSEFYSIDNLMNINSEIIDRELYKITQQKGNFVKEHTVLVPASGWTVVEGLPTQTITVPDISANSTILMCMPVTTNVNEVNAISNSIIHAVALGTNSITLKVYQTTPSIDIHLRFLVYGSA